MLPFPPISFAYVETHFRKRPLPSFLYRKEPEILFDTPSRLEPGKKLPAMLLIKDANLFPIELINITAAIGLIEQHRIFFKEFVPEQKKINSKIYFQTMEIPLPVDYSGQLHINFKLDYRIGNSLRFVLNDNIPSLLHAPCSLFIANTPLPVPYGWITGDMHTHSIFTNDEVEYGAPIEVMPMMAKAMGFSFAALLDHSYDLDNKNPFSEKDSFYLQKQFANKLSDDTFALFSGEEVSLINSKGKTVHAGVIEPYSLINGYRDSGRTFSTKNDARIDDLSQKSQGKIIFATHPCHSPGLFERILLNRGSWSRSDIDNVSHIQFMNGAIDTSFFKGRVLWIKSLLRGKKLFAVAGSDAHGDFSQTRRIGLPFINARKDNSHNFGISRTVIPSKINKNDILDAIKEGRAVISNGPFLSLLFKQENHQIETGQTFSGEGIFKITAISTSEFGAITAIKLYHGIIGTKREELISEWKPEPNIFSMDCEFAFVSKEHGYTRAEIYTGKGLNSITAGYAATNPIWNVE